MISTTPGTAIVQLTIKDENHLDGWIWSLTGRGEHDDLFKIVDSSIITGDNYIWPGDKTVQVHVTDGTTSLDVTRKIQIKDSGAVCESDEYLRIPQGTIGPWEDDLVLTTSFFMHELDSDIDVVGTETIPHVRVFQDGRIAVCDDTGTPVFMSSIQTVKPNVWNTVMVTRALVGGIPNNVYTLNGRFLASTGDNYLPPLVSTPIIIGKHVGSARELVITNVLLENGGTVYVREELMASPGTLEEVGPSILYGEDRYDEMDFS